MRYAPAVLFLLLAGCGSETTAFHSRDGKYLVICQGEEYRHCKETALKEGYIEGPPTARPFTSTPSR